MVHLLLAIIYLSFISLGLPDGLLGAAWPAMYEGMRVPLSGAGAISMIISAGTILSSLQSDRLTRRLGTGRVTAFSVALTCAALFGCSTSGRVWQLCLWAGPYGLGAGSVDASLNNYVALNFTSRHMSWLHCMWGLGASAGPYVMGWALSGGRGWAAGYRAIALVQLLLTAALFLSLSLWKGHAPRAGAPAPRALKLREIPRIPGALCAMIGFFLYSALEQTAALWASSYLTLHLGLSAESAARGASLFFIGITAGRMAAGFATFRFNDRQMIRLGQGVAALGALTLLLPAGEFGAIAGLVLVGLGCAPIFPSIIHATPYNFGPERSQALIGVQMASAYLGSLTMPPLFGLIANRVSPALLPYYLLGAAALMCLACERLNRRAQGPFE